MPRDSSKDLISKLPRDAQDLVKRFNKHRTNITCTKCVQIGTFEYSANSTQKPPQPVFMCSACKYTPHVTALEKEIRQAQVSPSSPAAVPISVPTNIEATTAPPNTRASRAKPKQTKIPTPAKKRTRAVRSDDEGEVDSTLTTFVPSATTPATVSPVDTFSPSPTLNMDTTDQASTMAAILAQLTAMNSTIASLKSEIDAFRTENANLKSQLVQSANKIASLEQTISLNDRRATLATVTKQQQQQGDDILDDDENYPLICGSDRSSTSKVDSNVAGPSKSKWAHPLNLEKITADRNKTDSKKLQNLNKLSAKLTKSSPSKKEATNQKQYNSAVRALTAPTSDPSAGFTYV
ncbi:hypothetical protein [Parasitella parasitica]|uniref:Uncharacterized protein n=1 Tax=Parasitella parasitica TaxID=35722 RepID=A0A0B7MME3_9FUNG|nr:hypothetical protein [Parasitella parasitica]